MSDTAWAPGDPDRRGAARYLLWLVRRQPRRVATGACYGSAWTVGLTLPPYLLSRAVDDGLRGGDDGALLGWAGALLAAAALNAWLAIMRHRTMTLARTDAAFRTVRVVVRHAVRLGAALPRLAGPGEVVTLGLGDVLRIGQVMTVTGPGVGSVIAYAVVAVLLLAVDPLLGGVVLLGVPVLGLVLGPLLGRLSGAETEYRERQSALTARLGDLVAGLRVLSGFGGKALYEERYRTASRELLAEGYRVGRVTSAVQALGVGLPTLFLAAVTWLSARMAAQGEITVGELVAVYGYVAVLVVPVSFFVEGAYDISRGLVSARRVVRFLALRPDPPAPTAPPRPDGALHDPDSGAEAAPGRLTALVAARPEDTAAVLERLGGAPGAADVLLAEADAHLFSGTLSEVVAGRCPLDEAAVVRALEAAAARELGVRTVLLDGARNLSGGQRQRLRLARALYAGPGALLAVEPTSAVDAHTEAAMAAGLRAARTGRTTLVTTTSPLVLEQADTVLFLDAGRVVASGTHRELLAARADYRAVVGR